MAAHGRLVLFVALAGATWMFPACRAGGHTSGPWATPTDTADVPEPAGEPLAIAVADRPTLPAGARIGLTASDGTGLVLTGLSTRAVLEGPLAFTEMRMAFTNPRPQTLEGTFTIVLPTGASIARFALRVGAAWQEGEGGERLRARVAH